jgi:hypothetical protein
MTFAASIGMSEGLKSETFISIRVDVQILILARLRNFEELNINIFHTTNLDLVYQIKIDCTGGAVKKIEVGSQWFIHKVHF